MAREGCGLEITELRLGLPGGGGGGGERKEKKRVFLDIIGGGEAVDFSVGDGGGGAAKLRYVEVAAVGWPPVCSYRKRALIKMYVKVSMDGAPFLRKIDINGFKGYSDLVVALENLFGIGDECDSEYIPIYEDKNGDWMLVGFVPWEIFTETCKRLRMKKRVLDGELQTKNLMRKTENFINDRQ